jgi:hypothetical protein
VHTDAGRLAASQRSLERCDSAFETLAAATEGGKGVEQPPAGRRWLVAAPPAGLAAGLTLLATRHEITIEGDSARYLLAADNLAAGRG